MKLYKFVPLALIFAIARTEVTADNYVIKYNLCLRGGIKNRQGFQRVVENNVFVDGGNDPHVWHLRCGDVFRRNINGTTYRPANIPPLSWGSEKGFNVLPREGASEELHASELSKQAGRDEHSILVDAQFVDPSSGDYRVKETSPVIAVGLCC